jgi:hypothetical protein
VLKLHSTEKGATRAPSSCVPSTDHQLIMPYPPEFIASIDETVGPLPSDYYEPDYVTDIKNLPANILSVLQKEEDYNIAVYKQQGVLFDLLKQLYGFKHNNTTSVEEDEETGEIEYTEHTGRQYAPCPQYYHYFAYTAYALLHGDIRMLNWRPLFNKGLHGKDVIEAINKLGIYGFTDNVEIGKQISRARFAALYARIYNADSRFQGVRAESPQTLHVEKRLSPLSYCPVCTVIQKAWDINKIAYYPHNPEYAQLFSQIRRQHENNKIEKNAAEDQTKYVQKGTLLSDVDFFGTT